MKRDNIIAEIEERDIIQLEKIHKEAFKRDTNTKKVKEFYDEIKNNKNIHVLGYYIDDKLVGTVTLHILTFPSCKDATIWNVAILEKYRRLGIATKLMKKAEEIAKKENIKRICLISSFQRKGAHELYKTLGYDENLDKAFIKNML